MLFIGVTRQRFRLKNHKANEKKEMSLSVIIPFRNEEKNLPRLIESIKNQSVTALQILFVDDHSEDRGKELLEKTFDCEEYISIYSLPDHIEGKKQAIDFGIKKSTGNYCLTLDADVEFHHDYFKSLSDYSNSDMTIAPVIMKSDSFWSKLFSFEYMLFNAFNYCFSSFFIISASGANLLFSREKYLKFNTLNEHSSLSSGDDHFLLRDFQRNKASISLINHLECAVYSGSAATWVEYFNQRIRWVSKTRKKVNWKEQMIGSVLFLYLIGSFILSIYLLIQNDFTLFFGVLSVRFLIDFFVFSNYGTKLRVLSLFQMFPVFFILYPIMFVLILIGSLFYQPKWKGRILIKKE